MALSQQDYFVKPGESLEAYNSRIAAARGDSAESLANMQSLTKQAVVNQSNPTLYTAPKNQLTNTGTGSATPVNLNPFTQPSLSLGSSDLQGLAARYGVSYTDPTELRSQYIQALQPTSRETELQTQLNDIRNQALGVKNAGQTGIQNIKEKPIAMDFITGQAKNVEERANLQLQTLASEEDALVRDLGLETSAREAKAKSLEAGLNFATEDRNFLMTLVSKVQDEQQRVIDNFLKYDQYQRTQAADILDSLQGVNPDTLGANTVAQLSQIAASRGIDVRDILSALKSNYQSSQADLLYKNAQTAKLGQSDTQPGENPQLYSGLSSQTATAVRAKVNAFKSEAIVTNFAQVQSGYNFTKTLSTTTQNPADDQALIYSLAKALDPGSVVREGEYATAQKYAQSWVQAYGKSVEQALFGTGFLSTEARNNIKKTIEQKYKSEKGVYQNLYNQYTKNINSLTGRNDGDKFIVDYAVPASEASSNYSTASDESILNNPVLNQTQAPQGNQSVFSWFTGLFK